MRLRKLCRSTEIARAPLCLVSLIIPVIDNSCSLLAISCNVATFNVGLGAR